MGEGTPPRIDRAALERIIQRAAELQTSERDLADELTPDQVLALGREVGIPERYLQRALLEERTRLVTAGARGRMGADRRAPPGDGPAHRPGRCARGRSGPRRVARGEGAACASSGANRGESPGSRWAGWRRRLRRSTAAFSRGSAAHAAEPGRHRSRPP